MVVVMVMVAAVALMLEPAGTLGHESHQMGKLKWKKEFNALPASFLETRKVCMLVRGEKAPMPQRTGGVPLSSHRCCLVGNCLFFFSRQFLFQVCDKNMDGVLTERKGAREFTRMFGLLWEFRDVYRAPRSFISTRLNGKPELEWVSFHMSPRSICASVIVCVCVCYRVCACVFDC